MASNNIQSSIPDANAKGEIHAILCLLFGKVFRDERTRIEIRRAADEHARLALDSNSAALLPDYVFWPDLEQDLYGNFGTLTDIYTAADAAKSRGWKAVVFVDELSWRQHTKTVMNLEDPTLTATIVNLECAPSDAVLSPDSTFYIRRLPLAMAMGEAMVPEPQKPKDWNAYVKYTPSLWYRMHSGFHLYNPFEPIFGNKTHVEDIRLRSKVLDLSPPLPEELKAQISLHAREETVPLRDLIDTRIGEESDFLVVPLLSLDEQEQETVRENLKGALDTTYPIKIRNWKPSRPATRRDFARIVEHFASWHRSLIFILNRPTAGQDLDMAVVTRPHDESHGPLAVQRKTLQSLNTEWLEKPGDNDFWRRERAARYSQLDSRIEIFLDPLWGFPRSTPPWFHQYPLVDLSSDAYINHNVLWALGHSQSLVFYLTKALTDADKQRVKEGFSDEGDWGNGGTFDPLFIPWENDTDGGPEDMLRIMKMTKSARNDGYYASEQLVFVDRQSPKDGTVIMCISHCDMKVSGDYVHDIFSGIEYGRTLAGNVDSFMANVPGNMFFEEYVPEEEIHFFQDPDYRRPEGYKEEVEKDDEE